MKSKKAEKYDPTTANAPAEDVSPVYGDLEVTYPPCVDDLPNIHSTRTLKLFLDNFEPKELEAIGHIVNASIKVGKDIAEADTRRFLTERIGDHYETWLNA